VNAAVSDGAGGYYLGGALTLGPATYGLVHVRRDGRIDHEWFGSTGSQDQIVYALARSGGTLYAGGALSQIGGRSLNDLAAIDTRTGQVTNWTPAAAGYGDSTFVDALAVSGSTVYVGGEFADLGGTPRDQLGAVSARTGKVLAWDPGDQESILQVSSLAVSGSTVYIAGQLNAPSYTGVGFAEAVSAAAAASRVWRLRLTGTDAPSGDALAVSGRTVYIGGSFTHAARAARSSLVAVDRRTGAVASWNAVVSGSDQPSNQAVEALALTGTVLYVGGSFTSIGGQQRTNIASLRTGTATATQWQPGADSDVSAIALSRSTVFAGGRFDSTGGWERHNLAVLDTRAGTPTRSSLAANGDVLALSVSGSNVYVGGGFTSLGGIRRDYLAALDAATGRVRGWDPQLNGSVDALAIAGSTLYAGGDFTTVGPARRGHVAAFGLSSGRVTPWNPETNGTVFAIAATPSRVYAGGTFTRIGGRRHRYLAEVDAGRGAVASFNPAPLFQGNCNSRFASSTGCNYSPGVYAIALSGSAVFAGGAFTSIGGKPIAFLAAVNPQTGRALSWSPDAGDVTVDLAVRRAELLAGGSYGINAYALHGGRPTQPPFRHLAFGTSTFTVSGGNLYAGGLNENATGAAAGEFEVFPAPSAASRDRQAAHPARPSVRLSFTTSGRPIPPSFSGLSLEYDELSRYAAAGPLFDRVIALIRPHDGQPLLLRLGGRSADDVYWKTPTAGAPRWVFRIGYGWLTRLAALVRRDRLQVMLDLNLAVHSPAMASNFVQAAGRALPRRALTAVAIGNEPDLFEHQPGLDRERVSTTGRSTPLRWSVRYSEQSYRRDYLGYARQLERVSPGIPLAAPETTTFEPAWVDGLVDLRALGPRMLAIHRYASSTCWPSNTPYYPTIRSLLSSAATIGLANSLRGAAAMARDRRLSLRVTEFGSSSCGGRVGVTNSFATALWAPEAMFALVRTGVSGVNWHIRPGLPNAPFTITGHGIAVRPELYGMALFARMVRPGARLLVTRMTGTRTADLAAWVVRAGRRTSVLLLNKSARSGVVRLEVGPRAGTARLIRLFAPSIRLSTHVTLGGQWIGRDARWHGRQVTTTVRAINGVEKVLVLGYSAALLDFRTAPR
jgi:hypothetical protein